MQASSRRDNRLDQDTDPLATEPDDFTQRSTVLIVLALVGLATTGYFLGLTAPMTAGIDSEQPAMATASRQTGAHDPTSLAIPAKAYWEIPAVQSAASRQLATRLSGLEQAAYDPNAKISVNVVEKIASLADRETRRAYDGAPPTVPHPIDQLDSAGCMACHGEGLRSNSLRAGKIPHPYYADCAQCHVEQRASFAMASARYENTFTGVAAPTHGGRAAPGASPVVPHTTWMREALEKRNPAVDWVPPVVPHTTWMRDDCLSCHGRTAAPGMETSHPWRTHCMQCHGESPQRNQAMPSDVSSFLPPPVIENSHE